MAGLWLLMLLFLVPPGQQLITLEIRVFLGGADVTKSSRVSVHRAGERAQAVGMARAGTSRITMQVPAGIYDAQAVHEQDGRVLNIRWAERLVVMPYPDEAGHHLEVINLTAGFGALQVRAPKEGPPLEEVALFPGGAQRHPARTTPNQDAYILFVVPGGQYDVQVRRGGRTSWHSNIEVPSDRTRLWLVP